MVNDVKIIMIISGIAAISLAIAVVGRKWIEGISRNPEASEKLFMPAIITLAFCEVFGLIIVVMLFIS